MLFVYVYMIAIDSEADAGLVLQSGTELCCRHC